MPWSAYRCRSLVRRDEKTKRRRRRCCASSSVVIPAARNTKERKGKDSDHFSKQFRAFPLDPLWENRIIYSDTKPKERRTRPDWRPLDWILVVSNPAAPCGIQQFRTVRGLGLPASRFPCPDLQASGLATSLPRSARRMPLTTLNSLLGSKKIEEKTHPSRCRRPELQEVFHTSEAPNERR